MKKLLLILLCFPMIGFGQTAQDYFEKANNYSESAASLEGLESSIEQWELALSNYLKCINTFLEPSYYPSGDYKEKLRELTETEKHHVYAAYYNSGSAHRALAERKGITYSGKEYDSAIFDFSRCIKLKPSDAKAYYERGLSYHYNGRHMRGFYFKFLHETKHYNRGAFQKTIIEHFRNAVDDYTTTIRIDPDDDIAYSNRGTAKLNIIQMQYLFEIEVEELGHCADYKRACNLGDNDACNAYKEYCTIK